VEFYNNTKIAITENKYMFASIAKKSLIATAMLVALLGVTLVFSPQYASADKNSDDAKAKCDKDPKSKECKDAKDKD
jgi:hypothetical protein